MAIQDLRFSVIVLIFPFCEVHREGVGNRKGIDKVKVQVHQNLARSFHHSLCVYFQSIYDVIIQVQYRVHINVTKRT